MTCKRVTDRFAVAPQLSPEALPALVQDGFSVLVCNRPDGEDDDQPAAEVMRAAAESAGMRFHHIPVAGGAFPAEAVAAAKPAARCSPIVAPAPVRSRSMRSPIPKD